ncbi:hypothetical protein IAT38_003215 [Cryptococcus sp. DSM 104549]
MFPKYLIALFPLLSPISAAPAPAPVAAPNPQPSIFTGLGKRQNGQCPTFALQDYADFQISDGVAGDAEARAKAVFVDPFVGCDLSTVDAQSLDNMATMREAAEDAETSLFNPQIAAASGALADSLQVGKIANKVLKLTGFQMVLSIQIAQGQTDRQEKFDAEQAKLDKNIATDKASAGETSTAAVGGGGNNAAAAAAGTASTGTTASGSTCTCSN